MTCTVGLSNSIRQINEKSIDVSRVYITLKGIDISGPKCTPSYYKQERLRGDAHQVAFGRNQWTLLINARVSLGENFRSGSLY